VGKRTVDLTSEPVDKEPYFDNLEPLSDVSRQQALSQTLHDYLNERHKARAFGVYRGAMV
jgi:hypothetical protein